MNDYELPECCTISIRRARKGHYCCECFNDITPGDHYEYVSGIWDHLPSSHKTCLSCVSVREDLGNQTWLYGGLQEEVADAICDGWRPSDINAAPEWVRETVRQAEP